MMKRNPTGSPLARFMQLEPVKTDFDMSLISNFRESVLLKERKLRGFAGGFIHNIDGFCATL